MRSTLLILCAAVAYASAKDLETVIGIDLGATNSHIAVLIDGRVEIIPNEQGNRETPSVVAFNNGDKFIGDAAEQYSINNPENTVFNVKRLLGKEWGDKTVQGDVKKFPYDVIAKDNRPYVSIKGIKQELFSPEEVTAMVVRKMKGDAEAYIGKNVTHAVVTVPTYFNDAERQATKKACAIAGIEVLRVINDLTAAAIAYGLDKAEGESNVLVFAVGGTTLDVTILNIDNGVIQTLATGGDTHLGGDNFDTRVMEYFIEIYKERGEDIESHKLRREVEKAKRALSSEHFVKIEIKSFFNGKDFSEMLTRDKFEELNKDLFESTLTYIENALKDAELGKEDIDEIILVGGSTRIPKIQKLVNELFGKEPSRSIEPEEVVAYGAALFADNIINEPEVPVYMSINPLTIGIEAAGGIMSKLIPRNTVTPTKQKRTFTTAHDNQMTAAIKIYEGERVMTKDNRFLGEFELIIPPEPKGKTQIEVTLEIDANDILKVTAVDKLRGVNETIVIEKYTDRWTAEYMEKMMSDAEKFAVEDEKARETVGNRELLLEGYCDVESEHKGQKLVEDEQGLRDEL